VSSHSLIVATNHVTDVIRKRVEATKWKAERSTIRTLLLLPSSTTVH
jgi:hypothetical protein